MELISILFVVVCGVAIGSIIGRKALGVNGVLVIISASIAGLFLTLLSKYLFIDRGIMGLVLTFITPILCNIIVIMMLPRVVVNIDFWADSVVMQFYYLVIIVILSYISYNALQVSLEIDKLYNMQSEVVTFNIVVSLLMAVGALTMLMLANETRAYVKARWCRADRDAKKVRP